MEIKFKDKKTMLLLLTFTVFLFWGLEHLEGILGLLHRIVRILFPFLLGGAIAFTVNVPMKRIEKILKPLFRERYSLLRAVSIFLSLFLALGIVIFVMIMVLPELLDTLVQLNEGFPAFLADVDRWIQGIGQNYPEIRDYLLSVELNWAEIARRALHMLQDGIANVVNSTWGVAATVVEGVVTTAVGLIFSLYILAQKEKLGMQFRKMIYAYFPKRAVAGILKVGQLANRMFSGFISGQCMEAVVFGMLCYGAMILCGFPYAACISVMIGFMTLLPIIGVFLGTALGALLIMVSSPMQSLWFIVMIIVLQQIDGNLIYPRIVGNSVGLPSMWVLAAVTIGGSLMGVVGILFFVPLFSVFYALLKESIYRNLKKKKITQEMIKEESHPCK